MEWIERIAPGVILGIIEDERLAKKYLRVLAKIYVKLEMLKRRAPTLQDEVDHQMKKEGLA